MSKAAGGPTYSVSSLSEASAVAGVRQSLVTMQASSDDVELLPNSKLVSTLRIRGFHFKTLRCSWSPTFHSALTKHCLNVGARIIHNHGLWSQPNFVAGNVARKLGLPLVISTRGMLEPWAWRHHAWKKRPVWWLWQQHHLRSAVALHATARQEVEALRALGLINPIALIPNGVDIPTNITQPFVRDKFRQRTALFISRIHPKKGLLNLVAAWNQLRPAGWRMIICGPDEGGHTKAVKEAVAKAGLTNAFEFKPAIYGVEKNALIERADLFVLPTFSENFGLAIAEALASEVPVITTKGTPWEELKTNRCGWWIELGIDPLVTALREAIGLSDEQRKEMGKRGRELAQDSYSWPEIGKKMKSVYEWILGNAERPDCLTK